MNMSLLAIVNVYSMLFSVQMSVWFQCEKAIAPTRGSTYIDIFPSFCHFRVNQDPFYNTAIKLWHLQNGGVFP